MHLLILHQAWLFGGAERTTLNLLRHLDRTVVSRITLAAPAALRDLLPAAYNEYVNTAGLIKHGWFESYESLQADVDGAAELLRRTQPDVALGMMHYSGALVAMGARRARVPVRTVASYRGPIYEYIRRHEHGMRRVLFLRGVIAVASRLADRILVPSEGTALDTRQRFFAPCARLQVIPNGIDAASVRAAAEAPTAELDQLPPGLPLLCVAARLSVEKDVGLLLDAARQLQAAHPCALVVVGDGPERAEMVRKVGEWGIGERVIFVGHKDNAFPYIRRSDVYVHTCQFEGFGYTMLEAMACGTPVIATDCPHGPREVLAGGACGVLVPPGDSGALSAAIARLLDNPQRRRELTQRGLERADELSVQRMARRYQAAFEALMPPCGPGSELGSGRRGDGLHAPGGQAANAAASDRRVADPVSCRTETRPAGAQASPSMRRNLTDTERPIMTAETNAPAQPGQSASDIDTVLARIGELPPKWHVAGSVGIQVLRAIAGHLQGRRIRHSAETGAGKTTLLFSHLSEHHTVFTIAGSADTINLVSKSPIVNLDTLEFVEGPSQLTLPRHDFPDKLQLAMIDGPHGYPFPDMEYWCLYPHLEPGALLIVDDIQIPTIYNLFRFIAEDEMFKLLEVVSTTAIFERTAAQTFEHLGDGWWLQNYNKARHPIKNFDVDPGDVHGAEIKTLIEQQRRLTNQVRRMGDRLEEQNLAKLGPRLQRMMRRLGLKQD